MFQKKLKGLKVFGGSTTGAAALVSARTASWSPEAFCLAQDTCMMSWLFTVFLIKTALLFYKKKYIYRFLSERGTEGTSSNNKQRPPCMEGD